MTRKSSVLPLMSRTKGKKYAVEQLAKLYVPNIKFSSEEGSLAKSEAIV